MKQAKKRFYEESWFLWLSVLAFMALAAGINTVWPDKVTYYERCYWCEYNNGSSGACDCDSTVLSREVTIPPYAWFSFIIIGLGLIALWMKHLTILYE